MSPRNFDRGGLLAKSSALTLLIALNALGLGQVIQSAGAADSQVRVVAGGDRTCVFAAEKRVQCWGAVDAGLQFSTKSNLISPDETVTEVALSTKHGCLLLADRTVKCWGAGSEGQLGLGYSLSETSSLNAQVVTDIEDVRQLSTGGSNSCALLGNTSVYCWGLNSNGNVGDGTTGQSDARALYRYSPVQAQDLNGAIQVSTAAKHSCALLDDATVKCWGSNAYGQLGTATYADSAIPVKVKSLTGVTKISAGAYHTCALLNTKTVKCWGANGNNQLGDGTNRDKTAPVSVSGLTGVESIWASAEGMHTCALLSTKTVKCWGDNQYGQLGNGTSVRPSSPVVVTGLTNAVSLATGANHTCAVKIDNSVVCWGKNHVGQLGDGAQTNQLSPVTAITIKYMTNKGAPKIVGSSRVGSVITVDSGYWDSGVTLSYRWIRDGIYLEGNRNPTFELMPRDTDSEISVEVTASKDGFEVLSNVSPSVSVALAEFSEVGDPSISGSGYLGSVLSVDPGVWDAGVTFTYQWLRDSVPVQGAVSSFYSLRQVDLDSAVSVRLIGAKYGYRSIEKESSSVSVDLAEFSSVGDPVVSGSGYLGSVLSVDPGVWDSGVTFTYQWLRDGVAIQGAVSSFYSLRQVDLDSAVSVHVVGSKDGFRTVEKDSSPVTATLAEFSSVGDPVVSGSGYLGSVLSVDPGVWDSGVTFTYQWLRDCIAIDGATSQKYSVSLEDLGSQISAEISASKVYFRSISLTTTALDIDLKIPGSPCKVGAQLSSTENLLYMSTISGSAKLGQKLKAKNGLWPSGYKLCSFWVSGSQLISGANGSTYSIQDKDINKDLQHVVIGTDKTGSSFLSFSFPLRVLAPTFENAKTPSIIGLARVGSKLVAKTSMWGPGVSLQYQWLRNGESIRTASPTVYLPTAVDYGATLSVRVCGYKHLYEPLCLTSEGQVIAIGQITSIGEVSISTASLKPGKSLIGSTKRWMNGVSFSSQWFADGIPLLGETNTTKVIQGSDRGKTITYQVTATADGYEPVTRTSKSKIIP